MNRALALVALFAALVVGCAPKKESCLPPNIKCGDQCLNGGNDPSNCGACGHVCGAGATCCDSVCVDLQTNDRNCGQCRHSCLGPGVADSDASCTAGVCVCTGAATDCGGACVNTTTDPAHCGDCTTACTVRGSQCQGGACGCYAPDPVECTSAVSSHPACTDLNDPQNCGTCGLSCTLPGKTACPAGNCACASGLTDCGALGCFDLQTDEAHCGACGTACPGSSPICSSGHCCPSGQDFCSGACVDTRSSATNCGACGHSCGAGQVCTAGTCGCPGATPLACGTSCCAGKICCGTSCQPALSNGLGGTFYSGCSTSPTLNRPLALAAADSWQVGIATYNLWCSGNCLARQTNDSCAMWCYDGTFPGQVTSGGVACDALCNNFIAGGASTWP